MLGGVLMQAVAFCADDKGGGRGVRGLIVRDGAAFIQAIDPIAQLLELFEGFIDVGDADDGQVGERSRGSFRDGFGQAGGAAFGNHHGGGSGGVGGADDGAQIMRVLNAIQQDDQAETGGSLFQRGGERRASEGHDILMVGCGAIELGAGFKAQRNIALAAQFDDLLKARTGGAARDENTIERHAGFKGFPNGMDSC